MVALVLLLAAGALRAALAHEVGEDCLACMCHAFTDCKRTPCVGNACGPFYITKAYWMDAGAPLPCGEQPERSIGTQQEYERCTLDPGCSAQTVNNYMKAHRKDCNKDGAINCADFLAIHMMGAGYCERFNWKASADFRKLESCLEEVSKLNAEQRP